MFLLVFLAFAFADDVVPTAQEAPIVQAPIPERPIEILFTGASFGVGKEVYPFSMKEAFEALQKKVELTSLRQTRGILQQGNQVLRSEDYTVRSLVRFLESSITCGEQSPRFGWKNQHDLFLSKVRIPDAESILGLPQVYQERLCTNAEGEKAYLVSPNGETELPSWELSAFDFRKGVILKTKDSESANAVLYLSATQDMMRIQHRIKNRSKEVLYVDAGSFVDSISSLPNVNLSMNRPLAYEILQSLSPSAVGIGETELIGGVNAFREEINGMALPYISTNLENEEAVSPFPRSRIVNIPYKEGRIRVAFLSLLDPSLMNNIPKIKEEGYHISDPILALDTELKALYGGENPPQTAILLTTAGSHLLEKVRRNAQGLSIIIGDPSLSTNRIKESKTTFHPYNHTEKGSPITLPLNGLGSLTLQFSEEFIETIQHNPVPIDDYAPANEAFRGILNQNRSQVYQKLDPILLSPQGEGQNARYNPSEWHSILCESLRHEYQADSVLIYSLPPPPNFAGDITELQLSEKLSNMEQLERHWVLGSKLKKILEQSKTSIQVSCGASAGNPKIDGHPIEGNRYYSILTTKETRIQANLTSSLRGAHSQRLLDKREMEYLYDNDQTPISLKKATLGSLRKIRKVYGLEKLNQTLLQDFPNQKTPLWLLRIRKVGLQTESFGGTENDSFDAVPDTMANAPTSSTQGGALDIAFDYSSQAINQDLRLRVGYANLTSEAISQEVTDDWILSTSISIPNLSFPQKGPLRWTLFSELLYDSEFTPIEQEDGNFNPKQSDLSLSVGFTSLPWSIFRNIRISAFGNRDLSQIELDRVEFGCKFQWESQSTLKGGLLWTSMGDVQIFADTPEDNASDLRFRGFAETKVSLPLARYLALSLYGQALTIKGRVEENADWGMATNIGVSFDLIGVFDL
ncbi:MAG: hypothetical protein VX278_20160 [Myxococcota bacterium]|nr:hypothetical protein [Myxococcota bacterium]